MTLDGLFKNMLANAGEYQSKLEMDGMTVLFRKEGDKVTPYHVTYSRAYVARMLQERTAAILGLKTPTSVMVSETIESYEDAELKEFVCVPSDKAEYREDQK